MTQHVISQPAIDALRKPTKRYCALLVIGVLASFKHCGAGARPDHPTNGSRTLWRVPDLASSYLAAVCMRRWCGGCFISFDPAEFLRTVPEADFRRVDIAFRIDGDVMHPFELAGLAAMPTPLREHLPVVAVDRDDLAVRPVGDENIFLCGIFRQHEIPNRTVLQSLRLDPELLHEGAILAEHLDAVIGAVADIDETVIR